MDTDVYIQAAAISHDIPGIICVKKKSSCYYFFRRHVYTDEDIAKCLIPFHVMIGCDANMTVLYDKMVLELWGKPSID